MLCSAFRTLAAMSHALKLTPEMQRFAEEQVHAGNYATVDDVARAAFALLRDNAQRRAQVSGELATLFSEMDDGNAVPTTSDTFAEMVRQRADKYRGE
jgi:putative addiction module CopG family antidote